MKKYHLLLLALSMLMGCKSNNSKEQLPVDYMLLSGTIKNATNDYLSLAIKGKYQIPLNGEFYSDTLRLGKERRVFLYLDNIMESVKFYYKPGLELNISFDKKKIYRITCCLWKW